MTRLPFRFAVRLGPGEVEHLSGEFDEATSELLRRYARAQQQARLRGLDRLARKFLAEHPAGSANAFHRQVGGNRSDALAAHKRAKVAGEGAEPGLASASPERPVLGLKNHLRELAS